MRTKRQPESVEHPVSDQDLRRYGERLPPQSEQLSDAAPQVSVEADFSTCPGLLIPEGVVDEGAVDATLEQNEHARGETDTGWDVVAQRHARVEAEVAAGVRDARSLIAFSAETVRRATLTFPEDPFGPPKPW